MNANTKDSQIKHYPCPKYIGIKRYRNIVIKFTEQKKHLKNDQEFKIYLSKYAIIKKLQYQHCQKSKMVRMEIYNLQTRLVQFQKAKNVINS